jgi:uncharacterized protein YeeX (DUF496 family)
MSYSSRSSHSLNLPRSSQCCIYCGKNYIKSVNLNKHIAICELLQKSKKRATINNEEDDDEPLPSQRKLFNMLIELGQKYLKLEEKIEEMNKHIVKNTKKINIVEWLNINIKPSSTFEHIIDKISVIESDIELLLTNSFYDVLNEIILRMNRNFNEEDYPMLAFEEKPNIFYVYTSDNVWSELEYNSLIKFLSKIHIKIFKTLNDWKKLKANAIKSSDTFSISCDKAIVKIMSIDFKKENTVSRVKNIIYTIIKKDMKTYIESSESEC